MKELHPQYIVDEKHNKKSVILPIDEWEEIMLLVEDLDDIQAYDDAKKIDDEIVPFDQAVKEIEDSSQK
ncbi:MAG: hypothetical protein V2J55_03320 [Candidatus Competibacteraceae bacterium]|jgi:hypothetical protein|nr:hypothetical protein [Candidatus Competibacteraceae bacterium]